MLSRVLLKFSEAYKAPTGRACLAVEFPDPIPEASLSQNLSKIDPDDRVAKHCTCMSISGQEAIGPTPQWGSHNFQVAGHLRG